MKRKIDLIGLIRIRYKNERYYVERGNQHISSYDDFKDAILKVRNGIYGYPKEGR